MSAARGQNKASLERLRREREEGDDKPLATTGGGFGGRLAVVGEADPVRVTIISDLLGESILHDRRKMEAILFSQSEVGARSLDVFRACVEIGEAIGNLRTTLAPDEYNRLVAAAPQVWGRHLSRGVVTQLVAVAASVRTKRVDPEQLPASYSIVYQFTTLNPEQLRKAQQEGIYHREVTRREVIRFKQSLVPDIAARDPGAVGRSIASRKELRRGRERLRAERRRLMARVEEIDGQIGSIEADLGEG